MLEDVLSVSDGLNALHNLNASDVSNVLGVLNNLIVSIHLMI